jgi:hypothetical protein
MAAPAYSWQTAQAPFTPIGAHTSNAALSSAVTLTPAAGADQLLIQALTQNVRVTVGGTTPTATLGFQLKAGDPAVLIGLSGATVIRVIEETASATIQYQWGN